MRALFPLGLESKRRTGDSLDPAACRAPEAPRTRVHEGRSAVPGEDNARQTVPLCLDHVAYRDDAPIGDREALSGIRCTVERHSHLNRSLTADHNDHPEEPHLGRRAWWTPRGDHHVLEMLPRRPATAALTTSVRTEPIPIHHRARRSFRAFSARPCLPRCHANQPRTAFRLVCARLIRHVLSPKLTEANITTGRAGTRADSVAGGIDPPPATGQHAYDAATFAPSFARRLPIACTFPSAFFSCSRFSPRRRATSPSPIASAMVTRPS